MFRFHAVGRFVLALALVAALAGSASAQGGRVPHRETCFGTLTDVFLEPVPTQEIFGVGRATTVGVYAIDGGHTFDPLTGALSGTFTQTALDGATLSGTYDGFFFPVADDVFVFRVSVRYLTGTGRLAGWTGEADTTAILFGSEAGSPFVYFTDGFLVRP